MKNIAIALLTSCSLLTVSPAYAQSKPAATAAPATTPASSEDCADNAYVPATEIPDDGKTNSKPESATDKNTTGKKSGTKSPEKKPVADKTKTKAGGAIKAGRSTVDTKGLQPGITSRYGDISQAGARNGLGQLYITSGDERSSTHTSPNTKHWTGNAIDLRCHAPYATASQCTGFQNDLRKTLGPGYYVVYEHSAKDPTNNHVHVQFGLKGGG